MVCLGVEIYGGCHVCKDKLVLDDQYDIVLRCDFARSIWGWVSSPHSIRPLFLANSYRDCEMDLCVKSEGLILPNDPGSNLHNTMEIMEGKKQNIV